MGGAEAARAFELGVDGFVRKPLAVLELLARVRRMLSRRRSSGRPARPRPGELSSAFVGDQLLEVVQMLGLDSRHGVLHVHGAGLSGTLTFRSGLIVGAETSSRRSGAEAAISVLSLRVGRFVFQAREVEAESALELPVEAALLEVLRLRDEAGSL